MTAGCSVRLGNHTGKALGALVTGIEADVLFDVLAQLDPMRLEVQQPRHRIDGEDVHRDMLQGVVFEHGIGQHVTAHPAATPTDQVDLGRQRPVLPEYLDDLLLQLLRGDDALAIAVSAPQP
ncbi:hypothetical protein D3C76_1209750 [compost metagenome]